MKHEYKILILGASYGSLLATKLVLAGHQVRMVCLPLEAELFNRVYQGTDEPVIYQGELCYQKDKAGRKTDKPLTIKRKSDTLLIFALKGKKPEVYRDTLNSNVNVTANVQTNVRIDLDKIPEQDLNYVIATLEAARIQEPGGTTGSSLPGPSETPEKET